MNVFVLNTEEDILWDVNFSTIEVLNGAPKKQPDYKFSSKYLPLCSEDIHTGLELLDGE